MTAKEILRKHYPYHTTDQENKLIEAMKEYAHIKCKEQREICTNCIEYYYDGGIKEDSIINAPEPKFD